MAGSEAAFAARMNAYARAMGMTNTTFRNANGLTREGHMSTARDMATLGRRLVYDFPQYYNIFGRTSTSAGLATVKNTNRRLLDAYPGADGIKTGYTKAAGFNVVSSAQRGNRRVIVALLGERSTAQRNADAAKLMDFGFSTMPAVAAVVPPAPLRTMVASAAPAATRRGPQPTASEATPVVAEASGALVLTGRPLPRALDSVEVSRNSASIAAAIAEVNSSLASQATRSPAMAAEARPLPRPGVPAGTDGALVGVVGRASTFAVAEADLPPRRDAGEVVSATPAGTTGGNEWGVQLGSYRAKGDAERQLLTTALMDVPELSGGLRRVEAARVQGVTVYRAQFVGLDQRSALAACASLSRMEADCLPLAPGI